MELSKGQIEACVKYWGQVIAQKGFKGKTPITRGLIDKFQRHLRKIIENDEVVMCVLNRIPQFPLDKALQTSKIENPFPSVWIETVFRGGGVDLFIDGFYVKELTDEDLA